MVDEIKYHRMKMLAACLAGCLAMFLIMGQTQKPPEVIEFENIKADTVRGGSVMVDHLTVKKQLTVGDPSSGQPWIAMGQDKGKSLIAMYGNKGKDIFLLLTVDDQNSGIVLLDTKLNGKITLGSTAAKGGCIQVMDETDKMIWSVGAVP